MSANKILSTQPKPTEGSKKMLIAMVGIGVICALLIVLSYEGTKERIEILKHSKKDPNSLINSCNEIYGACRHKPKFHRYVSRNPSTDESKKDERVTLNQSNNTNNMMCGKCLTEV